jgi:acetyl esterase
VRTSPLTGTIAGLAPAVVVTASLDPLRDQGRAYAAALIGAGVPTVFREAHGNIHGFINIRQAIPSSQGDVAGALAALKAMIDEAEGARVIAQAAQ